MAQTRSPEDILQGLTSILTYLTNNARHDRRFVPEQKAAEEVMKLLDAHNAQETAAPGRNRKSNRARREQVDVLRESISQIVSDVESGEHYDGSGWLDLKMHVNRWLATKAL